ncbi:receptor-like protein 35 [Neltuma alba]|uniref:receptor-like protein 35 n=1 Tax=Neltuma alba TaxID=207710 RepID=UPI0010A51AE4|nr:receptor-like protein 35 [Prosopis alba]
MVLGSLNDPFITQRMPAGLPLSDGFAIPFKPRTQFNSYLLPERDRRLLISKQGIVDPSTRLSSWSNLPDCCQWHGVECDLFIFKLIIFHYWLSRLPSLTTPNSGDIRLPSEIVWVQSLALPPLETLDLHDCNLTSSILSRRYANFSSLSYLDLGLKDFTNGLANWLFNVSKDHLSDLFLRQCNLRGRMPDFSGYRNLMYLDLSTSRLRGSIPDWLGQLDILAYLDVSNNLLHDTIPSDLLNASTLGYLDISFNDLSGALPKVLGDNKSPSSINGDIANLFPIGLNIFTSSNKFKERLPQISDAVLAL